MQMDSSSTQAQVFAAVPREIAAALNPMIDSTRMEGTLSNVTGLLVGLGHAVAQQESRDGLALNQQMHLLTGMVCAGLWWEMAQLPARRLEDQQQ